MQVKREFYYELSCLTKLSMYELQLAVHGNQNSALYQARSRGSVSLDTLYQLVVERQVLEPQEAFMLLKLYKQTDDDDE